MRLTSSDHARHARAELETIAAALRAHEIARLVALGRHLLEEHAQSPESPLRRLTTQR